MPWSVQYMNRGHGAIGEVMVVDLAPLSSVHVLHPHWNIQRGGEGSYVHVITLVVHGLHLLGRKGAGETDG